MKTLFLLLAFALSWFIQQSHAVAAGLPLTDLYGYSFKADWSIDETETCSACGAKTQPYVTTKSFTERIYVSTLGRLFHNRNAVVNGEQRHNFSMITTTNAQELIYDPTIGFISRVIPSDYNKDQTTFARVAKIAVARAENGFSCSVSTTLVLKEGEKDYIFFGSDSKNENLSEYQIHYFELTRSACSVSPGNIFSD